MYKHANVNLIGVMPDNVIPSIDETKDKGKDQVFIYFREDGDLYLFDTTLEHEFNLFTLPLPDNT